MHNIYSYHAKFNPLIPEYFIKKYFNEGDEILDPFCGSGTTLRVGLESNINTVGFDLSPIAYLNSKVKINNYNPQEIIKYLKILLENQTFRYVPVIPNKSVWFNEENLNDMELIFGAINCIKDEKYKDFFTLVFLSLLNKISNRRKTWNLGYIADNVLPNQDSKYCFKEEFNKKVMQLSKNENLKLDTVAKAKVKQLDLLTSKIEGEYDGVITSPPYPFAVDFIKYHRLALYWMEMDVDALSSKEVGARNKRSRKIAVDNFYSEMKTIYLKIMMTIKLDGYWCMTIANTERRKKEIKFIEWSTDLFQAEKWIIVENTKRQLEQQTMGQKRIPVETILVFQKKQ